MNEREIRDMVIKHDNNLDTLTEAVSTLAGNVSTTNNKLDDVIDVLGAQNVLIERMNNLDSNLRESFERVHLKIKAIEVTQNTEGCTVLKVNEQKVKDLIRTLGAVQIELKEAHKDLDKKISVGMFRWIVGAVVVTNVVFGAFMLQYLHTQDTKLAAHIATFTVTKSSIINKIETLKDFYDED